MAPSAPQTALHPLAMFKRNQRKSDTDLRGRRSLDAIRALAHARSSEQIPRHPPLPGTPEASAAADSEPPSTPMSTLRSKPANRFHLLRARNASDPTLGLRARQSSPPPPMPSTPVQPPPSIITTSPTNDIISSSPSTHSVKRAGTMRLWRKKEDRLDSSRPSLRQAQAASDPMTTRSSLSTRRLKSGPARNNSSLRHSRVTFDEPERPHNLLVAHSEPPPYDESSSTLPLPGPRLSESSRSTTSSSDHPIAYSTTTTTHTTTTTTFFRLPRRKRKDPAPLFPLPNKTSETITAPGSADDGRSLTPDGRRHSVHSHGSTPGTPRQSHQDDRSISTFLAGSALSIAGPGSPMVRSDSASSVPSSPRRHASVRSRSHTMNSITADMRHAPGKMALGGLLGRIRRDSEPTWGNSSRGPSPQPAFPTAGSSTAVARNLFIPERNDEDTPPVYLSKLFDAVSKTVVASLLARNGDPFHQAVLRAYMETFDFENDPMDMALRRLLMVVELPAETQQIGRVLDAFAERYHHCNPFIYRDADEACLISFSLIMLHTDFFNKNNKHKMQKTDYIKNTSRSISYGGISDDILECFYANITYTPFIRMEDEYDINGEKIVPHRPRKGLFHRTINAYDGRKLKEPIDPYLLIIDNHLELLRCGLKDVIQFEDPYTYTGTASRLDIAGLHRAFFRSGIIQIVSARSRPDAFMSQATMDNPEGADPGLVEMKVTKVGILWRKELKRKKTRSPWQEWGAILTGSQLYFFRNISWVKSLMNQYEQHQKNGTGTAVVFKPPLEEFKADAQISTDDAVALLDKSYKKHKNAFAFIRHGGIQEYFIADSETEMNDWLHKLNYAATFRTAGVRMRGVVGGNYEGQRSRGIRRLDSITSSVSETNSVQTPTGEVSVIRGGIDNKLAAEITAARREIIEQRIIDSEERLANSNRELQAHLRNGRHLSILCPIQPRVREAVMMAAATLAAKIRWVRVEMWKLQCHRDILLLDMEEERKTGKDFSKRISAINMVPPPTAGTTSSRISPIPSVQSSPTQHMVSSEPTPTQATFAVSPNEDLQRVPTHRSIPKSDRGRTRESVSTGIPRSASASSRGLRTDVSIIGTEDTLRSASRRSLTPTMSESSWNPDASDLEDEPTPASGSVPQKLKSSNSKKTKEEKEKSKLRRGLQRTLRTGDAHGHKRKQSGGENVASDDKKSSVDPASEGLHRGSGSFTVHGKKASVITFGSEWQNMSPEDRMMCRHRSIDVEATTPGVDPLAADRESLGGSLGLVRRPSQHAEGLQVPPGSLAGSRRGSYAAGGEELPDVPEGKPFVDEKKNGAVESSEPLTASVELNA